MPAAPAGRSKYRASRRTSPEAYSGAPAGREGLPALASSLSVTELLAPFRDDPTGTGVFTDFDGTLAPIVDDPAEARPLPGVVDALAALAGRDGRVVVISGRPA